MFSPLTAFGGIQFLLCRDDTVARNIVNYSLTNQIRAYLGDNVRQQLVFQTHDAILQH